MASDILPDLSADLSPVTSRHGGKRTLLLVCGATIVTALVTSLVVSSWAGGTRQEAGGGEPQIFDSVEVEIGNFNCSNNLPDGSVVHVTFRLFATIADGQQVAFKDVVQNRMNARVRQAVGKVIRSSSMEDLDDPAQSVVKRQLKEEINKVLRKSYINEVILVDFRMLQQ